MKEKQVRTYSADFVLDEPRWLETFAAHLSGDVYVTIDLDALDPAFMPATGTPEPGGITWQTYIKVVASCRQKSVAFAGFDVVELSPIARHGGA